MRSQARRNLRGLLLGIVALVLLLGLAYSAPDASADGAAGVPPLSVTGDVNCSGEINSIDAALLLQLEAALIDSLPCPDAADVNGDGIANSLDAVLLLQFDAGLQDSLARMFFVVKEPAGLCDDPDRPTTCDIPTGGKFDLSIVLDNVPPVGYIAFQTQLFFDRLTYNPTTFANEEILWPSGLGLRAPPTPGSTDGVVGHGGLSGLTLPLPASHYAGPMVQISLSCTETSGSFHLALIAYDQFARPGVRGSPGGASIVLAGFDGTDDGTRSMLITGRQDLDLDLDGNIDAFFEADRPIAATLEINCVADAP